VLREGIRTTHKLILRVPHGSRTHGHDRNLTLENQYSRTNFHFG
jgi:hypothetical protein